MVYDFFSSGSGLSDDDDDDDEDHRGRRRRSSNKLFLRNKIYQTKTRIIWK